MRSSKLSGYIAKEYSLHRDTARKQASRITAPILRLPCELLPKKEAFLYLREDRDTEKYWAALHRDLRETGAIYGMAVDGLMARGGAAQPTSCSVVTGAPVAQKKQVPARRVLQNLEDVGFIGRRVIGSCGDCLSFSPPYFGTLSEDRMRGRMLVEKILLNALRDWARKLGLASYNAIELRNDEFAPKFSTFQFDLAGPSYLLPLAARSAEKKKPGFLVGDVFCDGTLDENHIQYFLRKVRMLKSMRGVVPFLPLLLADRFTPAAFRKGRSHGIVMATPENLFGTQIAKSLGVLLSTLEHAGAIAAVDPDRIAELLESLSVIEGTAGNLRGALFELIVGYLVREVDGGSIDIGETVRDAVTFEQVEIDVRRIKGKHECSFYECRGYQPSSRMSRIEVEKWIERVGRIHRYHRQQPRFQNNRFCFELWTTGKFDQDAIAFLKSQKKKRIKIQLNWRNGKQVRDYAKRANRKSILDTLDQHYFKHPLAT